jgi:hypothetical protein
MLMRIRIENIILLYLFLLPPTSDRDVGVR